jgi:hypothetical protein
LEKSRASCSRRSGQGRRESWYSARPALEKATVGKLLAGKLTDEELLRGYVESFAGERYGLGGTVTGTVLVAPGQRQREYTWDELLDMLVTGDVAGIINVTAYGYHSLERLPSYKEHLAFESGMTKPRFLHAFLDHCRNEEIRQLESLVPALLRSRRKVWFMTLVTKQDLWWNKRAEVKRHYENGPYNELIGQIQRKVSAGRFPHEIASVSLTWENLRDGGNDTLALTVAGYDQRLRLASWIFQCGTGATDGDPIMNDAPEARGLEHRELLDMVERYAEKLRQTCNAYYERRTNWSRRIVVSFLMTGMVLCLALLFELNRLNGPPPPVDWQHDGPGIIVKMALIAIMAPTIGYLIWQSWSAIYRSRFDILPLVAALEKLVSRASQLEDRSVRDADAKVVFALKIAEAESALEYADWVTRSHPFWALCRRKYQNEVTTRHYRSRSVSL